MKEEVCSVYHLKFKFSLEGFKNNNLRIDQFDFKILFTAFIICQMKRKIALFINAIELLGKKWEQQHPIFTVVKIIPDAFVNSNDYVGSPIY